MEAFITHIVTAITGIMQQCGPIAGFILVILESIIPVLPLAAFIAINMLAFGTTWGFIISWIATIIGCLLAFYAFRLGFSKLLYRNIKVDGKIHKFMVFMTKIRFPQLVLILALPFTPAFIINIAGGLSKMPAHKFILALFISKLSIVYFWGYVGTSLLESVKNPYILLRIGVIMAIAYIFSSLIQKVLRMSEE